MKKQQKDYEKKLRASQMTYGVNKPGELLDPSSLLAKRDEKMPERDRKVNFPDVTAHFHV